MGNFYYSCVNKKEKQKNSLRNKVCTRTLSFTYKTHIKCNRIFFKKVKSKTVIDFPLMMGTFSLSGTRCQV